jgi:signal transduction histidine kinase
MDPSPRTSHLRPIQRRVLWFGILGFSLTVLVCWFTEYLFPPVIPRRLLAEAAIIGLLGFFTIRRTLHLCSHLEQTAGELQEKNARLREKTLQLEANRRKLLELDHLKSDFVAMVSHELRTPLTSIIGFAHTLRTLPLNPEQRTKYLGIIEDEGKRLAEMVEEFLDISKIEAGTLALQLGPVPISRLVQEVVEPIRLTAHAAITTDLDTSLPTISGDMNRLKRVLLNLLANAVRYTAEGTAVEISTRAADQGVRFQVRDHGPGLSRSAQERVFERFYRGADNIAKRTRGSGLGLTIAKAIVEKHGGRIGVESEPGAGATFFFWLPLHPPDHPLEPARPAHP